MTPLPCADCLTGEREPRRRRCTRCKNKRRAARERGEPVADAPAHQRPALERVREALDLGVTDARAASVTLGMTPREAGRLLARARREREREGAP